MALQTVDELQSRIAAVSDQDQLSTDLSTGDYALRLKYLNMAQTEWAETYDWQTLYKEFNTLTSTSTGNASISLPSDFRKLASFPLITYDGISAKSFPENRPQENKLFQDTDRHVNVLGNYGVGYTLRVLGVGLVSGASIMVPYYASAQSLVSPADVTMCPNPNFMVTRAIAYIMESRGDNRFTQYKIEAQNILKNMLEYENVFSEASTFDRIKTTEETRFSYRVGRD